MKQNVSIIFVLRKSKTNAKGKSPLYVRLSIDGLREEISTEIMLAETSWSAELKQVAETEPNHKLHNKRLRQIETDLERLVDRVQASGEIATPAKVLAAYRTPIRGVKIRAEKDKNQAFSCSAKQKRFLASNQEFYLRNE